MRATAILAALTAGVMPMLVIQGEAAQPAPPVELSAAPDRLTVTAGQPCRPTPVTLGMTNRTGEALYADSFLRGEEPLTLSRGGFSSYLPAGRTVEVSAGVSAPHGTEPGEYELALELAREAAPTGPVVRIPVEVASPDTGPGTNLLLGREVAPSSTYFTSDAAFWPCGGVDGDRTWSRETGWSSANRGQFPDTYTVILPEPATMNRVDLYTADSPGRYGLRDWDVQVRVGDEWRTVAQVRGNLQQHVSSRFEPVQATAVRIVGLAANDGDYSRIAEVEAYLDGPAT